MLTRVLGLAPEWRGLADAEELRWWLQDAADGKERCYGSQLQRMENRMSDTLAYGVSAEEL